MSYYLEARCINPDEIDDYCKASEAQHRAFTVTVRLGIRLDYAIQHGQDCTKLRAEYEIARAESRILAVVAEICREAADC